MHQEYSLYHGKPPRRFEIEALFRQVMLYITDTKKTHIILKSIYSSLSESIVNILIVPILTTCSTCIKSYN